MEAASPHRRLSPRSSAGRGARPQRPPQRRALATRDLGIAILSASIVVSAISTSSGCGVGDQLCTPDSIPGDKTDSCPFGPPGGPKPPVSDCADIVQLSGADCATPKTWIADVYPIIATDAPGTAACGLAICHGDASSFIRVYLPTDDPQKALDSLSSYKGSQQYPYINTANPAHSWILCNLEDPPGVGQVMPSPPGTITPEQIDIIRSWIACGAKYGGGSSGSGGGGGSGGAGGS